MQARDDQEAKQKKMKNLIIRGITEQDRDIVKRILKDIGCEAVETVKEMRIGKKSDDGTTRPRPIRVQLQNEEDKWKVIGRATKIRQVKTEAYETGRIFIVPDMTKLEREHDLALRNELKKKRQDSPNEKLAIRKGKIVIL